MKFIVGLGNPGEKYAKTRHNVGFVVLDRLVEQISPPAGGFKLSTKTKAEIAEGTIGEEEVVLLKPQNYMNNSGQVIQLYLDYYHKNFNVENMFVVHDDVDLELGRIKIQPGGGGSTHNGVSSIVAAAGGNFPRFRIGIGNDPSANREKYVLEKFTSEEWQVVDFAISRTKEALLTAIKFGLPSAMNQFNTAFVRDEHILI